MNLEKKTSNFRTIEYAKQHTICMVQKKKIQSYHRNAFKPNRLTWNGS